MGWKATAEITRKKAINLIMNSIDKTPYDKMTNEELIDLIYDLNIGDDINKPYYGCKFIIVDEK